MVAVLLGSTLAAAGEPDLAHGKEVFGPCAACHGDQGAGGKQGEYPRVAGQPTKFLVQTLLAYQEKRRANIPMAPYTVPRELSRQDMDDVAAYLSAIELPTRLPEFKGTETALEKLLATERVMRVAMVPGNLEHGEKLYRRKCGSCHGPRGKGRGPNPGLVAQYPNYLRRQVAAFVRGDRPHEQENAGEGVLVGLSEEDLTDLLAHLTALQDAPGPGSEPAAPPAP